jgi:hypothetical protein
MPKAGKYKWLPQKIVDILFVLQINNKTIIEFGPRRIYE